jgi:hypothetical protein
MSKLSHSGNADMDAIERQGRALDRQEARQDEKHTPTPWHWDAPVWDYNAEQEAPWLVSETEVRPIVLNVDGQGKIHITEANAAFICKAVNNHASLLEALKECLPGLQNPDAHRMAQNARIKKVLAAIAKATGESV